MAKKELTPYGVSAGQGAPRTYGQPVRQRPRDALEPEFCVCAASLIEHVRRRCPPIASMSRATRGLEPGARSRDHRAGSGGRLVGVGSRGQRPGLKVWDGRESRSLSYFEVLILSKVGKDTKKSLRVSEGQVGLYPRFEKIGTASKQPTSRICFLWTVLFLWTVGCSLMPS